MTAPPADQQQLHTVLLQLLAGAHDALTTAELRVRAQEVLRVDGAVPLVNEPVYKALRTLMRRGQVRHECTTGRHVRWSLTPTGAHTAEQLSSAARHTQDARQ